MLVVLMELEDIVEILKNDPEKCIYPGTPR
jgi:hypothetical protein